MRVSPQKRKELNKRDQAIKALHKSGYSYSEIVEKLQLKLEPARIGQIVTGYNSHNPKRA